MSAPNLGSQRNGVFVGVASIASAMTSVRDAIDEGVVDRCDSAIKHLDQMTTVAKPMLRYAGHWLAEVPVTIGDTTCASTAFAIVSVARKVVHAWSGISAKLEEAPHLWQELRPLLEQSLPTKQELRRVEPLLQIELNKPPSPVNVSGPEDVILFMEAREAFPEGFFLYGPSVEGPSQTVPKKEEESRSSQDKSIISEPKRESAKMDARYSADGTSPLTKYVGLLLKGRDMLDRAIGRDHEAQRILTTCGLDYVVRRADERIRKSKRRLSAECDNREARRLRLTLKIWTQRDERILNWNKGRIAGIKPPCRTDILIRRYRRLENKYQLFRACIDEARVDGTASVLTPLLTECRDTWNCYLKAALATSDSQGDRHIPQTTELQLNECIVKLYDYLKLPPKRGEGASKTAAEELPNPALKKPDVEVSEESPSEFPSKAKGGRPKISQEESKWRSLFLAGRKRQEKEWQGLADVTNNQWTGFIEFLSTDEGKKHFSEAPRDKKVWLDEIVKLFVTDAKKAIQKLKTEASSYRRRP